MTKTSPPSPIAASPAFQTTRASSNEYDTPAEASVAAAAATATTEAPSPPSTEDPHEDECVLCCYPFSSELDESLYYECCGEVICRGCIIAQQRTLVIGTNVKKPIAGSKEEESEFLTILSSERDCLCPFCRAKEPSNSKEHLKRLWERIDEYKDPKAMLMLGDHYMEGECGVSKNRKKAEELYQQAYDLGDPSAAGKLSELYTSTHVPDEARMMTCLEEGAKRGNSNCMTNLGVCAAQSGNHEEAQRQFMTAARSGHDQAVYNLMVYFRTPSSLVSKDELATTLRAHKAANDKVKSEPREYAMRHKDFRLKMISTGTLIPQEN